MVCSTHNKQDLQSFQTNGSWRNRKSKKREEVTVFRGLNSLVWDWSKPDHQTGAWGKASLDPLKDVELLDLFGRSIYREGLIAENPVLMDACGPWIQMPTDQMEERPASAVAPLSNLFALQSDSSFLILSPATISLTHTTFHWFQHIPFLLKLMHFLLLHVMVSSP